MFKGWSYKQKKPSDRSADFWKNFELLNVNQVPFQPPSFGGFKFN